MASYDFSLTTFEKTGKLAGVDHALAAVAKGQMSLGIQGEQAIDVSRGMASTLVCAAMMNQCSIFYPFNVNAATNGVVLASEKMLPSSLVETDSLSKIEALGDKSGVAYAGINADFRLLVKNG